MELVILNKLKALFKTDSLRGKIFQGGSVLTIGSFAENLLRFLRNMILARLLVPEAFGLMATIIATVAAAEAFAEVGLTQSIIQNKEGSNKEFLNVIWWFSAFRGVILYFMVFFAAPFITDFLNKPEATILLRITVVVILLRALISPRIYLLQKDLKFTKWVLLTQSASISGIILAVTSAFFFRNVWALVLGYVAEAFFIFLFSYVFYPLKPKFQFNLTYVRDIMRFSQKVFGLPILMVLFIQIDNFVIGRVLSLSTLGLYYLARSLADMATTIFSKISAVFLPAFSSIQDDKYKLKKTLLELTTIIATFGVPFFIFMIGFARPILTLVYSSEHSTIAVPFAIYCIFSFLYILSTLIVNMAFATGNPDQYRTASFVRTTVFLIILYPATKYLGLIGAALSTLFTMSLAIIIQIRYLKSLLNINMREYFGCFARGIKYSLILIPSIIAITFIHLQESSAVVLGAFFCVIAWCFGIVALISYKKDGVPNKFDY